LEHGCVCGYWRHSSSRPDFWPAQQIVKPMPSNSPGAVQRPSNLLGLLGILVRAVPLSFPWMNELQAEYGGKGLMIVAVNVDHDAAAAQQFLEQVPASFKIVYDPSGKIAQKYPLKGMPTSFLIGRDSTVRFEHDGFSTERRNEYLAHINALIAEKK